MISGEREHDIYVVQKNFATVSAVMSDIGTASGHLEKWLIRVKQYLNPREGESGPMKSKWTGSKQASGIGSFFGIRRLRRVIFDNEDML